MPLDCDARLWATHSNRVSSTRQLKIGTRQPHLIGV